MPSRATREFGAPLERTAVDEGRAKQREQERREKLTKGRTRSAFDVADEQAAEAKGAYKPREAKKSLPDNEGGMLGKAKRSLRARKYRLEEAEKKNQ